MYLIPLKSDRSFHLLFTWLTLTCTRFQIRATYTKSMKTHIRHDGTWYRALRSVNGSVTAAPWRLCSSQNRETSAKIQVKALVRSKHVTLSTSKLATTDTDSPSTFSFSSDCLYVFLSVRWVFLKVSSVLWVVVVRQHHLSLAKLYLNSFTSPLVKLFHSSCCSPFFFKKNPGSLCANVVSS